MAISFHKALVVRPSSHGPTVTI